MNVEPASVHDLQDINAEIGLENDELRQLVKDCLAHMHNETQSMAAYRKGREALAARAYAILGGPVTKE